MVRPLISDGDGWAFYAVNHDQHSTHGIIAYMLCLSEVVTAASRGPVAGGQVSVKEAPAVGPLTPLSPGEVHRGRRGVLSLRGSTWPQEDSRTYVYPVFPGPFGNPYLTQATSTGSQVTMSAIGGVLGLHYTVAAVRLTFSPLANTKP